VSTSTTNTNTNTNNPADDENENANGDDGLEETCAVSEQGVVLNITEDGFLVADLFFTCILYTAGAFLINESTPTAVCIIEDTAGACAVTVNDETCNSCEPVECAAGYLDYSIDCSNLQQLSPDNADDNDTGVWNFCVDDIPVESPFIAYGNNDYFFFETCFAENTASPSYLHQIPPKWI
jgi:hypothetical protein